MARQKDYKKFETLRAMLDPAGSDAAKDRLIAELLDAYGAVAEENERLRSNMATLCGHIRDDGPTRRAAVLAAIDEIERTNLAAFGAEATEEDHR